MEDINDLIRVFPLLSSEKLKRNILLNKFEALYQIIPFLGTPDADRYICLSLIEFARESRICYIRSIDMIERIILIKSEFLETLKLSLEELLESWLCSTHSLKKQLSIMPTNMHHIFDLWADVVRLKFLKTICYNSKIWKPEIMCIELTQQCNAMCGHCASNSSPFTKIRLSPNEVDRIVRQAGKAGVKYLGLTGGEPFLVMDTLLSSINAATECGVYFDYINSNCFWARTEDEAIAILRKIKAVAHPSHLKQKRGMFSFSVTTEHLRWVKLQNFINAIRAHAVVFPGQTLELVSVKGNLFGREQLSVFDKLISGLGNDVVETKYNEEGWPTKIYLKGFEIDIFFNYLVPIGRGEDMKYEDYEHYHLTDKELNRGLSKLYVDGNIIQTITIGWDGKSAPDVVLKCSESVIAGNLLLEEYEDIVAHGNDDPLIRGILENINHIISLSKLLGMYEKMVDSLNYHNTIQGYVSEFMKDPKKRLLLTLELFKEDVETQSGVICRDKANILSANYTIYKTVEASGIWLLDALRHLVNLFRYEYNFSRTAVSILPHEEKVDYQLELKQLP
jgi:organic radical activating enzyme